MSNKMQAKSKRNELVKSGAYDGRYRQRVSKSKKRPPRKTEKLKTASEIEEACYNQKSIDVIGDISLDSLDEKYVLFDSTDDSVATHVLTGKILLFDSLEEANDDWIGYPEQPIKVKELPLHWQKNIKNK